MHQTNIETLRHEAKRQLESLKKLLQKAVEKGLVEEAASDPGNRATFDKESLSKVLEVLEGETYKLDHLDMVLAVVGTMKAGKSTSINAIVGAEVLPNRNRPMTALPTLIRHTPGVLQPRLMFEKVSLLNELLTALARAVKKADMKILADLEDDRDMAELLAQVKRQEPFDTQYEGEESIFHFLKVLNDLVRLCFALEVPFPFEAYATVDSMPVIEVEFSHLKNTPATQGRLTLLDTPGPNEAGQQHLRGMLKDQLKKASAVLAVLDYTQLKSDADAHVRENLMEVAKTTKGRMYALVNKFDQKDRNSDDEATVRRYVAKALMKGAEMEEDSVFPVSSLRGYLASRARNEIERHGKVPAREPWVEDFGSLALGMSWDAEAAADAALMQRAADGLWKKSGFALPLEQVIVEAHRNAALEALRSAASKMYHVAHEAGDFFKASVKTLKTGAAELRKNIDNLQRDIENIASLEESTKKELQNALESMKDDVKEKSKRVRKEILETVDGYFKEGKSIEASRPPRKTATRKISKKKVVDDIDALTRAWPFSTAGAKPFPTIGGIFSPPKKRKEGSDEDESAQDFDPKNPVIPFDEKSEATDFREKIEKSIRNVMTKAEGELKTSIQSGIDGFSENLERCRLESLETIRKSVQKEIDGFDIEIILPNAGSVSLDTSVSGILENIVEEKSRIVTKHRRKSGTWGTVCRWFNTDDWGWESYKSSEDYYEVDLRKIEMSSTAGVETLFASADAALDQEIYPQLHQGVETFFGVFRDKIEHVRGDLLSGIQRQNLAHEKKAAILESSAQLAREATGLEKDCETLNDSAEALHREEGQSLVRAKVLA